MKSKSTSRQIADNVESIDNSSSMEKPGAVGKFGTPISGAVVGTFGAESARAQVHVRRVARKGKKCWTTIEGVDSGDVHNLFGLLKKKVCRCGGGVAVNDDGSLTIQLQGSHVEKVKGFLVGSGVFAEKDVVCHG